MVNQQRKERDSAVVEESKYNTYDEFLCESMDFSKGVKVYAVFPTVCLRKFLHVFSYCVFTVAYFYAEALFLVRGKVKFLKI